MRGTLEDRFWAKVDKRGADECWLWTGTAVRGYGSIGLGARRLGHDYAHRVSWTIAYGAIPAGLFILHKCDTPRCVNPGHLFLGTQADNIKDAAAKGRLVNKQMLKSHCDKGHPLFGPNLLREDPKGFRRCRICRREYTRLYQRRHRANRKGEHHGDDSPNSTV